MKAVRKLSFRRKKGEKETRDYAPMYKTERYHPKIRSNLEIHTEDQGFISHNDNAYTISVKAGDGDLAQSLNAIYNIPTSPYDDKFVVEIADIPMEYKQHIGKNISVPDEADGNNLTGQILGIRTLVLKDLGEYFFYEVLFQPNEENSKAVVKLICTQKYGIKVLGLETEAEIMQRINEAYAAMKDSEHSVPMKILQAKAAFDEEKRSKRGSKLPMTFNLAKQLYGDNYANNMIQQGRASQVDPLEFYKPTSSSSLSRSSSPSPSSPKSRRGSPETLRKGPSFGSKTTAGKKTKKAKKTKKMQKRKKTKRR